MCFMTIVFLDQKFWSIFKLFEGALLVESNFKTISKVGVRGTGQVFLGRYSSQFVPRMSKDGTTFSDSARMRMAGS